MAIIVLSQDAATVGLLTPPDIEALAINWLRQRINVDACTERPADTDWTKAEQSPLVRLSVVDGYRKSIVLDVATLAVEVWAADSVDAAELAGNIAGAFAAWEGATVGATVIYKAEPGRPRRYPDPETGTPRYLLTVTIHSRLLHR